MAITIDPQINALAEGVARTTGLDKMVVLAHWESEQGVSSLNDWFNFNPAGIRPGNPDADAIAIGVKQGFNAFPHAVAGAQAYTALITGDRNYPMVREAIKTKDPKKQLDALIASPWDSGHYTNKVQGDKLYAAYERVTGAKIGTNPGSVFAQPGSQQRETIDEFRNSEFKKFFGIPDGLGGKEVGIVVVGSILIILFVYRLATK